jgi:hypothetical protein
MRETGQVFMAPTYFFIVCLLGMIGIGLVKTLLSDGQPIPVVPPHPLPSMATTVGLWVILQSFASGCTAMTGVEAVSNGVKAFRDPPVDTARRTLTAIIGILIVMLAGIAWLARAYHVGATDPGLPGYESLLSQLIAAVAGKGLFYYVSMASILAVLALSANTAFADFPRLCQIVADDGYLPHGFSSRGRRLVFTQGIYVLAFLAGLLLVVFRGVTDRLIPLYAVGAFLAFTLSQAGMVVHWRRLGGAGSTRSILINGLGAVATAGTVTVVLAAKFVEGAWVTVLLIPLLLIFMTRVNRHYRAVGREIELNAPLDLTNLMDPIVIVPLQGWNKISQKGLRFAVHLSNEVYALQVLATDKIEDLSGRWNELVEKPALAIGHPAPKLTVVRSPYRQLFTPILSFVAEIDRQYPDRYIAVLVPELVEHHWSHYFLHNQRASVLKALLLLKGNQRINIINVPWYLDV